MGLTEAVFDDVIHSTIRLFRIVQRINGGRVSDIEVDGMAHAAWETFVGNMKEAGGG
jgi:hypothetical protein